jgi:predicted Zn finger-like uncharacterized protein
MKDVSSLPPDSSVGVAPATCPACQSSSIVTKAKTPDADTYWRCTSCGEVWNVARSPLHRNRPGRWR